MGEDGRREMEEVNVAQVLRVKTSQVQVIRDQGPRIRQLFNVKLSELPKQDLYSHDVFFRVETEDQPLELPALQQVQRYVEWLTGKEEGEDSSYDSDGPDGDETKHQEVSRTASDTLGAEFAEYVTAPDYTARLEFALKLGYTERQVQAALAALPPQPDQNQLLAELIKIGAQSGSGGGLGSDGSGDWDDEDGLGYESASVLSVASSGLHHHHHPSHHTVYHHDESTRLRPVVIDGSNVAMSHGNKEVFSCRGIKICVDWFRARGHKEITVFVPKWRKEASRPDNPITEQEILGELERERLLVFTPSRLVGGKRLVCYDDRYILRLAAENQGIVVSNDNYRDLAQESPEFRKVVEERILMYSFVNDRFMPPDDPLGRSGPTLDNFLRLRRSEPPPPCPYGKKCTYGVKCKFQHPERGAFPHKTVTERLVEHAQRQLQARTSDSSPGKQLKGKSLSLPLSCETADKPSRKAPLSRTKSIATAGGCLEGGQQQQQQSQYYQTNSETGGSAASLHKKLARQLTLNPAGDPRLWKHQHGMLTRHHSTDYPAPPPPSGCGGHSGVARISSAPGAQGGGGGSGLGGGAGGGGALGGALSGRSLLHSSSGSRPQHHISSNSEPQLGRHHQPPPPSTSDRRRLLHYHLASIFPEEQVSAAMQLYPHETNPQKICAAILTLFPTGQ